MKKILALIFILALSCSVLAACGGESASVREENDTVSGDAVSVEDDSVSGAAIDGSSPVYNYANSTNYYWMDRYKEFGFYGYKRDGSSETKYRIKKFEGLLAVTEDAVYYSRGSSEKKGISLLCQVPVTKGGDGTDVLDLEEEEVLLEEKGGIMNNDENASPGIYVGEDYIVYLTYKDSEQVVRYDRTSNEITRYTPCDDQVTEIGYAGNGILVLVSDYGGFFRMNLETGEIERFDGSEDMNTIAPRASYGRRFIYATESEQSYGSDKLWTYDVTTNRKKKLLTAESLYEICGRLVQPEEGMQEMDDVSFDQLICQGDRLYIQVEVRWSNGEKEYCRYMMFSLDLSKGGQEPEYEKEMTECMWNNSDEGYDDENEEYLNSGRCRAIVEGKAFLVLNKKGKWRQQVGCYDLVDGTFKIVTKEMEEYCMPYFDSMGPYGYGDWELEEWLGSIC